jgi:hypothetical protein
MLGLFNVDGVHIGNNYFVLLAVVPSIWVTFLVSEYLSIWVTSAWRDRAQRR